MRSATAAGRSGQDGEQSAPSDAPDEHLGGTGRGSGTKRGQHDVPAVGKRNALRREPQDDGLEARRVSDSDAEADKRASDLSVQTPPRSRRRPRSRPVRAM
jgi:hypothetical protein